MQGILQRYNLFSSFRSEFCNVSPKFPGKAVHFRWLRRLRFVSLLNGAYHHRKRFTFSYFFPGEALVRGSWVTQILEDPYRPQGLPLALQFSASFEIRFYKVDTFLFGSNFKIHQFSFLAIFFVSNVS